MFINKDSLAERIRLSNSNLDSVKFRRNHSVEKIDSTDESIKIDSTPLSIEDLKNNTGLVVLDLPKRGRPEGYKNKTEAEKVLIGIESRLLGQTEAARLNGVSQPYAGLCENGKRNTDGATLPDLNRIKKVDSEFNILRSQALEGLKTSVSVLNGKLSDDMKTNDAIGVASTLVKIVSISTPDEKRDQASRLIIMAPQLRDEKLYETIDIG